ncbi:MULTISPECIES: small acid-soluble spore protein SspI [Beduini]|uniref:small acid-soluble spore protein SspI n=1 Tax=Beduini TaxID=1922299 RepID=UPI00059AA5D4|nr:small acid-soluble spore protein SspI [Beduini massiliensis]
MDIREAVHHRLKNASANELKSVINDSIHSPDEAVLPGLGVLFEDYYNTLDASGQANLCNVLSSLLK